VYVVETGVDRNSRRGTRADKLDQIHHLAKVMVAGSNRVFRSKLLILLRRVVWIAGFVFAAAWRANDAGRSLGPTSTTWA